MLNIIKSICSVSLREMQMKTTMRDYFISIRTTTMKITSVDKNMEKSEPS